MDGALQKIVSIIIAVVILFILPIYIAYEKRDDISYALALKITTDFVDNVNSKGYITSEMYTDYITKLAVTQNSYDVYLEHTAKKYNPVIYSYTDDLKTIRAKFDYNLYKDEFEDGQITVSDGSNAGTYNNLILAYDLSEKKYNEEQILSVISSTDRSLSINMNLEAYKNMDYRSLPAIVSIYMPEKSAGVYTMNEGDEFSVIVKNKNTTMASVIYNVITFGASAKNNTKIYVNYGGTVKAEQYRTKEIIDETPVPPSTGVEQESSLLASYNTNGLVMLLEGEYNDGSVHSNDTNIWKDYSANNHNALLSDFDFKDESGWRHNGLHFTGKEYASIADIATGDMTIEIVARFDSVSNPETPEQSVLSNLNDGVMGLVLNELNSTSITKRGKFSFEVYTQDGSISSVVADEIVQANKIYSISGSVGKMNLEYDGNRFAYETRAQLLSVNGKVDGIPFNSTVKLPLSGSDFIIGGNPLIGVGAQTSFNGTIYCVRIYNRALTEEEIKENYKVDQKKYGIE